VHSRVSASSERHRFEDVTIAIHVRPEWLRLYHERDYVRIDPSIRYCKQMVRPFRTSDAPYMPSASRTLFRL
jgi:LuxR family quorum sensing-dependent transcriptional regulator